MIPFQCYATRNTQREQSCDNSSRTGSYLDIHPPFLHSEEKAGVLIGAHANYETTEDGRLLYHNDKTGEETYESPYLARLNKYKNCDLAIW